MSDSGENTIAQNNKILEAVAALSKKVDDYKKEADAQFEAIRQGLVANSSAFDRLESVVYGVRSDISKLKADVRDLTEEVKQGQKSLSLK